MFVGRGSNCISYVVNAKREGAANAMGRTLSEKAISSLQAQQVMQ